MKPILFVCASDTLVNLLLPIAEKIISSKQQVAFATLNFTDEAAEFELGIRINRLNYVGKIQHNEQWLRNYQAIVMGNDWGTEIRALILLARRLQIPTICIQESVINFTDKLKRMQYADFAFVQGEISSQALKKYRNNIIITGNPRYENLVITPSKNFDNIIVNCNFTYGVEEEYRDSWLETILKVCDLLGKSVTILQHPRDRANLIGYKKNVIKTNASTIHNSLKTGSLLITRFSSLIHESIALGLPVIYFNPHNESAGYNFGEESPVFRYATDEKELKSTLIAIETNTPTLKDYEEFLRLHINYQDIKPSTLCAQEILKISHREHLVLNSNNIDKVWRIVLLSKQILFLLYKLLQRRF